MLDDDIIDIMRPIVIAGIEMVEGKNILLLTPDDTDPEVELEVLNYLRERFTGVNFTVLSGGFQAIVLNDDSDMIIGEIDE